MELEQVYWYFFIKFRNLTAPRSVAEANITSEELKFLQDWFAIQFGKPRNWCDRTWQEKVEDDHTASSREMFGALFLILASELCRDHCSEEAIWPIVAENLKANKTTHSVLFTNQNPSELSKLAMAAGVRKLQLRNLIDRSGKQEYFDTIKLQIGFTYKGALRRLPDWLDGLGSTTAVQILSGTDSTLEDSDVSSLSFKRLWTALRDYRSQRISFFRRHRFSVNHLGLGKLGSLRCWKLLSCTSNGRSRSCPMSQQNTFRRRYSNPFSVGT